MDWQGYILQGLFMGLGSGAAAYLHTKHISTKMDKLEKMLKRRIKFISPNSNPRRHGKQKQKPR